ncbi:hypothetical protein RHSIM_Rhsim01G0098000 [Rhododendron simsii]|uniref:Uncharacterized protein n=1 Tax=Rhododendron simsii TaxID=118357 RepID=A0A834HJL3_RHOSS|nr:hypothetical protein RHSIM_Rhsim01G0098000 [Rhododendron simsii]
MPQDRLRSFVKCDDPKGVVECGTVRKSKSNPKRLEEKAESRKMPKNSNSSSSSAYKEAGKEMVREKDKEDNPSSFQLLEVPKGAQQLNQVIDSWSKGMNFDGNSKEIAKDLLKGALDLQESLIMLGKLQEASQYMAKLKKKQKERSKGEKIDQREKSMGEREMKLRPKGSVKKGIKALKWKKPEEVENVKSKGAIKWQDEAKVTSPKERRPEVGSIIAKSRVSEQKYTSSSVISKHAKPAIPQNIGDRKKNRNNERPVKAPLAADFVIIVHTVENESEGCKYGGKLMDISCENQADTTIIYPTAADQLLTNEIDEQCDSSQNFPYDFLPQTTQHESFNESAEETKHCISQKVTETICFRTETNAEDLILSSPPFLSYAEELYDINSNNAIHLKPTN